MGVANFTVVYDACELFPASVRDLVVEVARDFEPRAVGSIRVVAHVG
jgi:hypothetical protein